MGDQRRSILKRSLFACCLLGFAATDIVVYVAALWGRAIGSWFILALVLNAFFWAIALSRKKQDRRIEKHISPGRNASWKEILMGGLLVAFCAVNCVLTAGPAPVRDGDGYYLKTLTGKHIEISRQEYDDELRLQTRLFSGTWLAINLAFVSGFVFRKRP